MKKLLPLALLIALLFPNQVTGQEYMQAGIRTGFRGGIFFQMPSYSGNKEIAYNAMLGFNNHGIQITGLKIIYETSISEISPDLYFAWGYGGHAGFIVTDKIYYYGDRYNFPEKRCYPIFGVDGWAAAEYRFREIPLIISLNLKPYVELTIPVFVRIMPIDLGISVSYVF
jgi:hypothetical protein